MGDLPRLSLFACTFCTWGSAVGTKMFGFPLDRLRAELEWIARSEIEYVYLGDSNFGMLPQDDAIADMMVETKARFGFPKRVLANTAKNSTRRIFELSRKLHAAGLSKGATLSMQSWSKETLTQIKRANIKSTTYESLQTTFREAGVPTYSELILGLPGETLSSFCAGIDKTLDAGQHDGLFTYLCRVLPGSEMDADNYRAKHGIETELHPIQANHGSLDAEGIEPTEYEETVVGTSTMPRHDWIEAQRVAWFVECFFALGFARLPLLELRKQGVRVTEFARWAWWELTRGREALLYPRLFAERARVDRYLASSPPEMPRDGLDCFPAIRWPIAEASFLALNTRKDEALSEVAALLYAFCQQRGLSPSNDAVIENGRRLRHWTTEEDPPLRDPMEWAKRVVWWGRRESSLLR